MALSLTELEATTRYYFMADNKKAIDIYFEDSFLMDLLMKKKRGIWERPAGGERIRIPLNYDEQEGGFYNKASILSSDDRESIQAAFFQWKHVYGNATIHRIDELKNAGDYADVQLVESRIYGAQKTARKKIADQLYSSVTDSAMELTGLLSLTTGPSSVTYGGIAENDLVSADGVTKPWAAKSTTDSENISLAVLRKLRSSVKVGSGKGGKPDIGITTEDLFNVISGALQVQQRFQEDKDTVNAGFTNLVFEGMLIAADDYCPSGDFFALNSNFIGFAVHKKGYFSRDPWANLTPTGVPGKSMKIFWDGNLVCSNRKAHTVHTNLS